MTENDINVKNTKQPDNLRKRGRRERNIKYGVIWTRRNEETIAEDKEEDRRQAD